MSFFKNALIAGLLAALPTLAPAEPLPQEYPSITLRMTPTTAGVTTLVGYALAEAVRQEYMASAHRPLELNWLEILHYNLESTRVVLSEITGMSPNSTWSSLEKSKPTEVAEIMDTFQVPPLKEWRNLDLSTHDGYYEASVKFVEADSDASGGELLFLASEKYRRTIALGQGLPAESSWESVYIDTFFKLAPDEIIAQVSAETWQNLPNLMAREYYRRMQGRIDERNLHMPWHVHLLFDLEEQRRDLAEYLGKDPGAAWSELNRSDPVFIKEVMSGGFDLPDPTVWQNIDSPNEQVYMAALGAALGTTSTDESIIEELAAERVRRIKTESLRLPPDTSWNEILLFDMLHESPVNKEFKVPDFLIPIS